MRVNRRRLYALRMDAEALATSLAAHIEARAARLDAIRQYGNRFEAWLKWELAAAYHQDALSGKAGFQAVAVERPHREDDGQKNCDLALFSQPWPEEDWSNPPQDDRDVWLELKARCTSDKGPADLAAGIWRDIERQKVRAVRPGTYGVAALILRSPWFPKRRVDRWAANVAERIGSKAAIRHLCSTLQDEAQTDDPVACLLTWVV